MSKKDMILALIEHFSDGNKARFANMLGISPQGLSTWIKRGTFDNELIFSKCEGLSASWLLTGQGSMLKQDATEADSKTEQQPNSLKQGDFAPLMQLIHDKDQIIREQAEEIGHLKARVEGMERRRGDNAHDALIDNAHAG